MRNAYLYIFCLCTLTGFSQTFNYQAVVRNAAGDPVTNQSIGVEIGIREGGPLGETLYYETHTTTSNAHGVISLSIGTGTSSGTLNDVDWSTQNQWLGIGVDITGGTTYVQLGNSKLNYVPYALYALKSGNTGPFSTTTNVTSNASGDTTADDYVFGSTQIENDTGTTSDDNRFFFDKSSGIFRAGRALNDEWNYANMGSYSVAFGSNNIAKGSSSSVFGTSNSAEAFNAFVSGENNSVSNVAINSAAFGTGNTNSGLTTFAVGITNVLTATSGIALGSNLYADSYNQINIGYNNTQLTGNLIAPVLTDRLFVVGNGSSPNSRSDALVILKNGNTTLNGTLKIDGDNQGAGTAYTLPAQDGSSNQVMQTNGAGVVSWVNNAASTTFSTTANVTSNASGDTTTDDFVFGSTQLADNVNTEDDNIRFIFDKGKGAFRSGNSNDSSKWEGANLGFYSGSFGFENIASGSQSFASGGFNNVSGFYAVAMGHNNQVDGISASAIGESLTSESYFQVSLGGFNTGASGTSNVPVATDRLFVIGNGTAVHNRSDALVMLKNGNTTLNGELTTNSLKVNNLPSFAADLTNHIPITSAGYWVTIHTWTTASSTATQLHDDGDHFNESNGWFVAPVDGLYQFNSQVRIDGVTSGFVRLILAVNGIQNLDGGFHAIKTGSADTLYETLNVGGVMKLTEGDTVSLQVFVSADENWVIDSESGFNGYLINKL
ncbi:C1q-like domain-containing protein [Aquimarina sp. 2201CG5-10]|uniref:C1q-like domain-containing protein n=1 Tax=Aquimarina callyspongiae TaxID=3098150 RepID=UPI002AB46DE9|nr:hypothetical protein [Aquimarina sp. 2201CG5-10]MDY8134328.1 hypothetical protein [Aquimarina sp. 2201CG5-10]